MSGDDAVVPTGEHLLPPGASSNIMNVNNPNLTSLIEATLHSDSSSAFDTYETYVAQQLPGHINMPMPYGIEATASNIRNTHEAYDVVSTGLDPEDWYVVTRSGRTESGPRESCAGS